MRANKPVIGVTPWYDREKKTSFIKNLYCKAIVKAGGIPVLLPLIVNGSLFNDYFNLCDGILLTGGNDVDASLYNERNLPCNGRIFPERDKLELFLCRKAIENNIPVLGICRGIQVMNVAMGGTLYQDIYSQIPDGGLIKHSQDAPKWYPTHEVKLEENSILKDIFHLDNLNVNTFHHQAVKDVAPGFKVSARSCDGIIEAIEYISHVFAVGVQWHPEYMWKKDNSVLKLFEKFVSSCSVAEA